MPDTSTPHTQLVTQPTSPFTILLALYKRVTINSANDSLALTGVIEDLEVSLRFLCIIVLDLVIVLLQEDYCKTAASSSLQNSCNGINSYTRIIL